MDRFDRESLVELASRTEGPCVSVFMRTHPTGADGEQDAIRLKNLLRSVEHKLAGHWMSNDDAKKFVAQAMALTTDTSFWSARGQGMAIYMAPDYLRSLRVQTPLVEQAVVNNRFRVRPMLPLLGSGQSCLLLSLSENKVRCYKLDEETISAVEVPNLPVDMETSLNYSSADRGAQVHTATRDLQGKQGGVFHGHGGKRDSHQNDLQTFLGMVNDAMTSWLGDSQTPLLLACVDSVATSYRKKNTYKCLVPSNYSGNHDHETEHELQQGAWRAAKAALPNASDPIVTRFIERKCTNKASDDLATVLSAASEGRVDALLYDAKAELFGRRNPEGWAITGNSEDDDLVDVAAVETLTHRGSIHPMGEDVPTNSPLAALLRY